MAGTQQYVTARDNARALGRFTRAEYQERLGLSTAGATHHLVLLKRAGIIAEVGRDPDDGRVRLYEYVKPVAVSVERTRREPVEVEVARAHRGVLGAKGAPVAGISARRRRGLQKEAGELIARIEAVEGWSVGERRKHSYIVYRPDGVPVTSVPITPSDHRTLANCWAELKRMGFPTDQNRAVRATA